MKSDFLLKENEQFEIKRADNIIWTLSDNYALKPYDRAFIGEEASLYQNMIIGALYRFQGEALIEYREHLLKKVRHGDDFAKILDICIEEHIYEKLLFERPVLENLRREYYQEVLKSFEYKKPGTVEENLNFGNSQRVLGLVPKIPLLDMKFLYSIVGISTLKPEELVKAFAKLIRERFHFDDMVFHEEFFEEFFEKFEKRKSEGQGGDSQEDDENYDIQSAEFTGRAAVGDVREDTGEAVEFINKNYSKKQVEKYINENFGLLSIPIDELRRLQKEVCIGMHADNHIHITRGRIRESAKKLFRPMEMQAQRERNIDYYNANIILNNRHIHKLNSLLKHELQNHSDLDLKSDSGILVASDVWKKIYLDEDKIFSNKSDEDFDFYNVNLLIDSSASQRERQEMISSGCYVLSKALEKLDIPLRIWGFSSLRDYTVLTMYKDFHEREPHNVFNYYASNGNRDGLAISTLTSLIKKDAGNNLLIVVSDGKPNDCRVNANSLKDDGSDYKGEPAIKDSAMQVRYARNHGIKVFGIFYGEEEEVSAMKSIYGNHFAYIKSPEHFSDIIAFYLKLLLKDE